MNNRAHPQCAGVRVGPACASAVTPTVVSRTPVACMSTLCALVYVHVMYSPCMALYSLTEYAAAASRQFHSDAASLCCGVPRVPRPVRHHTSRLSFSYSLYTPFTNHCVVRIRCVASAVYATIVYAAVLISITLQFRATRAMPPCAVI